MLERKRDQQYYGLIQNTWQRPLQSDCLKPESTGVGVFNRYKQITEFHGILHGRDSRKTSSKRRLLQKTYKRKDARTGIRVPAQREQEATAQVNS